MDFAQAYSWLHVRFLFGGLWMTLQVALMAIVISLLCGVLMGVVRYWRIPGISAAIGLVADVIRNLPLLLLLFCAYFALPQFGVRLPVFWATILALSVFEAAMISEIVRGSIVSLPPGQAEAGLASGLTKAQTMWYVQLPQALRRSVPSLVSQLIALIKDSSLATILSLPELTHRAKLIYGRQPQYAIAMFVLLAVAYFCICFALSRYARTLEAGRKRRSLFGHL